MPRWLYALLIFGILATLLDFLHVSPLLVFVCAGLGIIPLAALIGQSVEQVAEHTGERIGGLLFATFGNATELIIGIFALSEGLVDVVRASIIGSILANALLVLGVAICVGGFKHGRLRFETRTASQYASLLALCVGGLLLPTFAELLASRTHQLQIVERGVLLSDFIAVLLLLGYIASILFSVFHVGDKNAEETLDPVIGARSESAIERLLAYRRHLQESSKPGHSGVLRQIDSTVDAIFEHEMQHPGEQQDAPKLGLVETPEKQGEGEKRVEQKPERKPNLWFALLLLTLATAGVAWLSEILVGSIEPFTTALHWNAAFVGLVFVPLIGGLPEYFNTITMVLEKRMGMVLAASAGSSIQIALLMAPILVLVSLVMTQRLDLVFSVVELAVLGLATFLFSEITKDGELVWLEGLLLLLLYAMMGGTVFLFGA
jgi:Ca2+:H+ antiporter